MTVMSGKITKSPKRSSLTQCHTAIPRNPLWRNQSHWYPSSQNEMKKLVFPAIILHLHCKAIRGPGTTCVNGMIYNMNHAPEQDWNKSDLEKTVLSSPKQPDYQNETKWMVFQTTILHCKAILGWGQPGLIRWISLWIMPQSRTNYSTCWPAVRLANLGEWDDL